MIVGFNAGGKIIWEQNYRVDYDWIGSQKTKGFGMQEDNSLVYCLSGYGEEETWRGKQQR